MSHRKWFATAAFALAVGLAGNPTVHASQKWDFALAYPPGNFMVKSAERFAAEVEKATDGAVKITVHPGGALGYKGPEMLGVIRDGLVPMGSMLLNQQVGVEPFFGIESVPYLVSGFTEIRAMQLFARPIYDELAAKHNQKILYLLPWPGQNVHAKSQLTKMADFKSLKIRTVDRNGSEFFSKLGAVAVQMPWGEVVPSLASGAINAVTTSSSSGVDGKFWEFLGYFNQINWQSNSDMVTVNLNRWRSLTEAQRNAIETVARRLEAEFWATAIAEDEEKIKVLQKGGMKVVQPTPELKAELQETARGSWDEFATRVPRAKPVIENYRRMVGK